MKKPSDEELAGLPAPVLKYISYLEHLVSRYRRSALMAVDELSTVIDDELEHVPSRELQHAAENVYISRTADSILADAVPNLGDYLEAFMRIVEDKK